MDLGAAIRYPTNEDGWPTTRAIGTVLEVLTFLVVPQIVL